MGFQGLIPCLSVAASFASMLDCHQGGLVHAVAVRQSIAYALQATQAVAALREAVDTLIVIPNDRLLSSEHAMQLAACI